MAIDPAVFAKQTPEERRAYLQQRFSSLNLPSSSSTVSSNTTNTSTITPAASSGPAGSVGGVNYGSASEAQKRMLEKQKKKELNDAQPRQNEINRTLAILRDPANVGKDMTAQEKYLRTNLGYDGTVDLTPNRSVSNVAGTNTFPTATPSPSIDPKKQLEDQLQKDRLETTSLITQLEAARKQKAIADLQKSKDAALSNLNKEQSTIQPQFTSARNQTAARSTQDARNFAEFMAARGGTRAGSAAQAEISRGTALQGNLGALDQQENQILSDIERRRTDVGNAFASDVASANAGIDADSMNQLLDAFYRAQSRGDTLTQRIIENEFTRAGLTGVLDGELTLAGRDLQFNQDLARKQFDLALRQQDFTEAQQNWINKFNFGQATGTFSNGQMTLAKQQFDENIRQFGVEVALKEAGIAQDAKQFAASQGLQWEQLERSDQRAIADLAYKEKYLDFQKTQANLPEEPTKSEIEANYVTGIDSIPADKRADFFKNEKDNIVADLGISGYNTLFNMYFDKYGALKP